MGIAAGTLDGLSHLGGYEATPFSLQVATLYLRDGSITKNQEVFNGKINVYINRNYYDVCSFLMLSKSQLRMITGTGLLSHGVHLL
jgi:hypothetical protein